MTVDYDRLMNFAALVVAIVGMAAGIWAAVFATRADAATRKAMLDASERYDQEARPRLEPVGVQAREYGPTNFVMEIANRGGATPLFVFTVQSERHTFIASGSLDEHTRESFEFMYVGDVLYSTGQFSTPFVVAQDRLGRWWDCTLQHLLAGTVIKGSFHKWIDARLAERGMMDLLDAQMTFRVVDYRSEEMLKDFRGRQRKNDRSRIA